MFSQQLQCVLSTSTTRAALQDMSFFMPACFGDRHHSSQVLKQPVKIQKKGNETLSLHTKTINVKSYTSRQCQQKIRSFGDFIRTATYTCHVLVQPANSHFFSFKKRKGERNIVMEIHQFSLRLNLLRR